MDKKHFDIAIIGSGAGLIVMEEAQKAGKTVALIEKGAFGGTCLNHGCIPSKMLVYPADLIRNARMGGRVGIHFDTPRIDWQKITRRMRQQVDQNIALEEQLGQDQSLTLYKGAASFVDPHTLAIQLKDNSTEQITAGQIVIAAGSRTRIPHIDGLQQAGYVTSESFFGDRFPKKPYESLVIIGGGSTACEMAGIFSAFGSKVTLAVRSETILRGMDLDIPPFVKQELEAAGVDVRYFAGAKSVRTTANGLKAVLFKDKQTNKEYEVIAEEIFLAPGVVPNTPDLNLPMAGVHADENGFIITNEYLGTNVPHIWAIGDINGKYPLRHKANWEAHILNEHLFHGGKRAADYSTVPQAVFTHPQVAAVGLTQQEAVRQYGSKVRIYRNRTSSVVAGISMGYSRHKPDDGFAKIITDDKGKILGAHVAGPNAALLVQPYAYLMNAGGQESRPGSIDPVLHAMTIHPSFSELTAWSVMYNPPDSE